MRILPIFAGMALWVSAGPAEGVSDEDLLSRDFWERRASEVRNSRDSAGRDLTERANYCILLKKRVHEAAVSGMNYLWERTIARSSGNVEPYISYGDYQKLERLIQMYSTVAYRDIGSAMYDGADTALCEKHAEYAAQRIRDLLNKFPE